MILSSFIIIFLILISELIGQQISYLLFRKKFTFNVPLGFICIMAFFELLTFIPATLSWSSNIFYILIPILIIISIVLIVLCGKDTINHFKSVRNEKYLYITCGLSIVLGIYMFIVSQPNDDSWLFLPMIVSTIQTGQIYSSVLYDGTLVIPGFHSTDTYYLFQSVLASISSIDPIMFSITFFKFFEGVIVVTSMAIVFESIFVNKKSTILFIYVFTLIASITLLTFYITFNSVGGFLIEDCAVGISMLLSLIFPMFIIFITKRDKIENCALFISIITLSSIAFTSSAIYIVPIFLTIISILDILLYKSLKNILSYIIGILICFSFVFFHILVPNGEYALYFVALICLFILFFIVKKIMKHISINVVKKITILGICVYVFGCLFISINYIINSFSLNGVKENLINGTLHEYLYGTGEFFYPEYLGNILIIPMIIVGLFWLYKNEKSLFHYICAMFLLFGNIFIVYSLGMLIGVNVYHRVVSLVMFNIAIIASIYFIYEILESRRKIYGHILTGSLIAIILIIGTPQVPATSEGMEYNSFVNYKFGSNDVVSLYEYDFSESEYLELRIDAIDSNIQNKSLDLFLNDKINYIYRYRSDLEIIDYCLEDCYILLDKDDKVPENSEVVLELESYVLVYQK